ncbi:MAG: threonine/serine dehydratase [bacterium]
MNLQSIFAAKRRIQAHIRATPLELSHALSRETNSPIYLKLENWQITGSFKIRGAFNKLLSLSEKEKHKGIITASAGNHALGVAHAAGILGIHGKIVLPQDASPAKVQALQNYDLELVQEGQDYDQAEQIAYELQRKEGLTFVHAFSDPDIIAAQGTVGLEIVAEQPEVRSIVVPIGGGGLVAGVAIAAKSINPKIKIIGVQSEASPAMYNAVKAGKVVETPIAETVADGLAGRFVTELTLKLANDFVDDIVLVSEQAIKEALRLILANEHIWLEGSAAVGVAALLENRIRPTGRTALVLTGRNAGLKQMEGLI